MQDSRITRIAAKSNTASKQPERFPENYPKEIVRGKGAYIFDEDGNKYLDFMCSLGPIILGHRYDPVDEAVIRTIKDEGTIFSLSHPKERILADLLHDIIPSAEMTRLVHNGKDATEAAIRLARHITGRELILSFSYHGASDVFMATTKADKGVPQCLKLTITEFDYNDLKTLTKLFEKNEVAGVIMEPHTIRQPLNDFLQKVIDLCNHYGALLIFDEVVTFPRYPGFSAQTYFGVTPDLTCISKGMANGYPISALVGKEKYMRELRDFGVFVSTTFGGNLIGVSAAIATLTEVVEKNVPEYLESLGIEFRQGLDVKTTGYPWRQFMDCDENTRIKLWQELIKKGCFFGVPIFFNYSMTHNEMKETRDKINNLIKKIDEVKVVGRNPSEVFKKV